jgi:hypothetical protein
MKLGKGSWGLAHPMSLTELISLRLFLIYAKISQSLSSYFLISPMLVTRPAHLNPLYLYLVIQDN